MKKVIYKNPVLSAVLINIFGVILIIYSMSRYNFSIFAISIIIGTLNRKIINNGIDMNKQKKIIINTSFFLMIGILLWYILYLRDMRISQIIN